MSTTLTPTSTPATAAQGEAQTAAPATPALGHGPFLVATDGAERSDVALRAAHAIAARSSAAVEVLTVLDPLPIVTPEIQLPITPEMEAQRRDDRLAAVRAQIARAAGGGNWPLRIGEGSPMMTIADHAGDMGARLIVVGLGRHGMLERLFGDETALQLLRLADAPVLAVAASFEPPPRHIVAAIDFSPSSIRALRVAVELADPHATIDLVHVVTRDMSTAVWEQWQRTYSASVLKAFEDVRAELRIPSTFSVETFLVHGDPSREILSFADRVNADLISTGSHGHGFFSRMLLGSVATRILRGARCSVLGVPHPATRRVGADGLAAGERAAARIPRDDWADQLAALSRRNAGRRVTIEVDDPELGSQAQGDDFPLLGVAYDRHDGRVEVMLGDVDGAGLHLTRGIADVTDIELLRDGDGRDITLCIKHGKGQTLVSFLP